MGCSDLESNAQRAVFEGGKWHSLWGDLPSWEGPIEALVERFPDFHEPSFIIGAKAYTVERTGETTAIIRPLGRIVIENI